jgi:hypothetical protein
MRPPMTLRDVASRGNTTYFGIVLALLAGLIGWAIYANGYIVQVWRGPVSSKAVDVAALGAKSEGVWYDVSLSNAPANQILRTTTTTTRRRGGQSTSITNHFAIATPQGIMLYETQESTMPQRFTAWAQKFDATSEYHRRATTQLASWATRGQAPPPPIVPILLRHSDSVGFSRNLLFGGLGLATLLLSFLLWRSLRRVLDYLKTPWIAGLKKSVRAEEGVPALVADIDQQLATLPPTAKRTGIISLPRWFVNVTGNKATLISADDVVYIAPYIQSNKTFGFTTSKSNFISIISRTGTSVDLAVRDDAVSGLLQELYYWAPWAVVGSDPDMEQYFGKNSGGLKRIFISGAPKADLLKAVDARRAEVARLRREYAEKQAQQLPSEPETPAQPIPQTAS